MHSLKYFAINSCQQIKCGTKLSSNTLKVKHLYLPQRLMSSLFEVGSKKYFADLVSKNNIVVFMKGTPDAPKCGFSNAVAEILRMHGVDSYSAYNVLDDDKIRQGIKEFSDWPTIPQVYLNGEFVGGCDILIQMHQNGELIDELQKIGITSALLENELKKDEEKKT